MSRVGKLKILIPENLKINIEDNVVTLTRDNITLERKFNNQVKISFDQGYLSVSPMFDNKESLSMWGTVRSTIDSMVEGLTKEFTKELELIGVGFKAAVKLFENRQFLELSVGKSHNTKIEFSDKIKVSVPKPNSLIISSFDKCSLGDFVYKIKQQRPVEPYKGKGIIEKGQYVYRKVGKKK